MRMFLVSLSALAVAALVCSAGQVTEYTAQFTGANGTTVAPGTTLGYTNLGCELANWTAYPRPPTDPNIEGPPNEDRFYITNNQLFMYVGPCTNNPAVYNKVMCSLLPQEAPNDPVYLTLNSGQVEAEFDLNEAVVNAGHRWNLQQEVKLILRDTPTFVDPGGADNAYLIKCTFRPVGLSNVTVQPMMPWTNATGGKAAANLTSTNLAQPITSTKLRMVLDPAGVVKTYIGETLLGQSTSLYPIATVYPYMWHGKFNGEGGVVADGSATIDNLSIKWTPEPGAFALLLLALPLVRKLR